LTTQFFVPQQLTMPPKFIIFLLNFFKKFLIYLTISLTIFIGLGGRCLPRRSSDVAHRNEAGAHIPWPTKLVSRKFQNAENKGLETTFKIKNTTVKRFTKRGHSAELSRSPAKPPVSTRLQAEAGNRFVHLGFRTTKDQPRK